VTRRTVPAIRAVLARLAKVEALVQRLQTNLDQGDFGYPHLPRPDPRRRPKSPDKAASNQAAARARRLEPRKGAVAATLRQLDRLLTAAFVDELVAAIPSDTKPSYCAGYGGAMQPRPALLRICPWACGDCCSAALEEIETCQRRLEAELPVAMAVTRGDGLVYRANGELTATAIKLLRVLPGRKEPAPPRSLAEIALAAGLGHDKVRKLSPRMHRLGLTMQDADGCWRRLVPKP
jgi:hypothetical protein